MRYYELVEAPLPADWDASAFKSGRGNSTFKSRIDYAVQRAQRLGTGSSRRVFTIEFEGRPTALKIATNGRGLGQNAAELAILDDGYLSRLPIVIPLIDYDRENPQPVWIQTEQAQRVTPAQLRQFMKAPLEMVGHAAHHNAFGGQDYQNQYHGAVERLRKKGASDQDIETFAQYVDWMHDLLHNTDLMVGDLIYHRNWGLYQGRPVLIDLGCTRAVYRQHYTSRP